MTLQNDKIINIKLKFFHRHSGRVIRWLSD